MAKNDFISNDTLISIIIPCYNHGSFLGETLESVLCQTHGNWECIIVNDGSTDQTEEISRFYCFKDQRIKLVNKENGGLSSARNAGLKESKGALIAFLDADDRWEAGKLKNQLSFFINGTADIVFSDYCFFDKKKVFPHNEAPVPALFNLSDFIARNPCRASSSSVMITRAVFKKVGFFDLNLRSLEDLDYWFRCFLQGFRFVFSEQKDVFLRKHDSSMQTNFIKMFFYHFILLEKQLNYIEKYTQNVNKKEIQLAINDRLSKMRWYALQARRRDLAISVHLSGWNYTGSTYFNFNNVKAIISDLLGIAK